jgi:pimeloyl-ACP methyl ester carboxylesterase
VDHATSLSQFIADGRRGEAVEYFMTTVVGLPAEFVAGARSAPWWAASEALAHTLVYDMTLVRDSTLRSLPLAQVQTPVLVAAGAESQPGLVQAARAVAAALPNASLRLLEGQTHDVSPDALAPVLVKFFSEQKESVQ